MRGTASVIYQEVGRTEGAPQACGERGVQGEGNGVVDAVVAPAIQGGSGGGVVADETIYRGLNRALREQGMIPADRGVGALERGREPGISNGSIDSSFNDSKNDVNRSENGTYESVNNYDNVCEN